MKVHTAHALRALLLAGAVAVAAGPAQAGASLGVVASNPSHMVGESFTVDIEVSGAIDLFAYQLDLRFDPQVLQAVSSNEGSFLATAGSTVFIAGTIDNAGGAISFVAGALIGALQGASGDGALARVTFTSMAKGVSELSLGQVLLLDSSLSGIDAVIGAPAQVVVDAATPPPVPEPASGVLLALGLLAMAWRRQAARCGH